MPPSSVRTRAVAILLHEDNILLMRRINHGKEYFVFPGGGVEAQESVSQAVIREVQEEASIDVQITRLLYRHVYDDGSEQHYYLCHYVRGVPRLGKANESESMARGDDQFFEPGWYQVPALQQMLIYPLEIRDWLLTDLRSGFSDTPRTGTYRLADLRQSL